MSLIYTLHVVLTSPSQNKTFGFFYYYLLYSAILGNMSCTSWRGNISLAHFNKTRIYTM
jgi:hypothetical protein